MAERPRMLKVDPEMQRWCALLEEDVSTWPDVTGRAMFGMRAFYRGPTIFAALPRTRAMGTSHSIILKLPTTRGEQLLGRGPGAHWASFALHSADDIHEALRWIGRAYEKARVVARPRNDRRRGSGDADTARVSRWVDSGIRRGSSGRTARGDIRPAHQGRPGRRSVIVYRSRDRRGDRKRPDCPGLRRTSSSSEATGVIDARGKIVTPGLVDIHAHLDAEMPPSHCLSTGVTAIVDAGSRGADNIGELVAMANGAPNRSGSC